MRIDLDEMAQRLGRAVPESYRHFVMSSPSAAHGTLADPAEICALNLGVRAFDEAGATTAGFLLCGQDGDYYLLRHGDESGLIYAWSHETSEIEPTDTHVNDLLTQLAATPIRDDVDAGTVLLSRVQPVSQSMLDPIRFDELAAAAEGVANAAAFEFMEGVNPFTKEPFRIRAPGIAIGEELTLRLSDGHLYVNDVQAPLPEEIRVLAERLKARIFAG